MIISGRDIAERVLGRRKSLPVPSKKFIAILVGDDPASLSFLKRKEKIARELDIAFHLERVPETARTEDIQAVIRKFCDDASVGGIIIQLPLPKHVDRAAVLSLFCADKDIDNLSGRSRVLAPAAVTTKEILDYQNLSMRGKIAVVVGKGLLVGRPIAEWLRMQGARVIILDTKTGLGPLKEADLIIGGTGVAGLIKPEMLKRPVGIIDFGYALGDDQKLYGDFDASGLSDSGGDSLWYTPTPGGTGPLLVAELFVNFYELNS